MHHPHPILVTGAAGRVGAIGPVVTKALLDRGFTVRAMVRREDDRSMALRSLGAEVVVGNLLDLHDVYRVLKGCRRVYFSMSVDSTYLEAATNTAVVCKHHGVDAFVNMSQMTVSQMSIHETTDSPQHKQHWLAEQVLRWSGLPLVHLRPTAFMDVFFLQLCAPTIRRNGAIMLPFGSGKASPIAAVDVGRCVTAVLADPAPHIGKIYELTGPAPTPSRRSLNSTRACSVGRSRTWTFPSSPGKRSCGSQECRPTLPRISSRWPPCTDRTATTAIPIMSRS